MLSSTEAEGIHLLNMPSNLSGTFHPQAEQIFLTVPSRSKVDNQRQAMEQYIHERVGYDIAPRPLKFTSSGYLAARVRD